MKPKSKALKKKMPVSITIIRHGETKLNKEKRIRGWSDVPLDKESKPIIERTGKELRGKLDLLVSSDLERAEDTAKIISEIADIPIVEVSEDFRPWDVGDHTGEPQNIVYKHMENYARNKPGVKVEGGESFNNFKERFLSAVERLKKEYQGERIGIVTHHRGDRIFAAWHKKGFPSNYEVDLDVFCSPGGIDPGEPAKPVEL